MGPAGLALELNPDDYADVYATFYDQFKPPFEPLMNDGKTIGVATRWGWVGPCINTDVTKPEVWKTYDPVFDPANKDKICVMDWGDWPILPMALHAGINPYEELDQAALEEVRKVLRAMFKNTRTLVGDLTQAQKGLLDGSLLGCIGAGSYLTSAVRKQGHKNIMAIVPDPKNGLKQGIIWVEATAILKETDQPELAQKLLKHVVSKESGPHPVAARYHLQRRHQQGGGRTLYARGEATSCRPTTCGMPGTIPRCTASRPTSTRCWRSGRKSWPPRNNGWRPDARQCARPARPFRDLQSRMTDVPILAISDVHKSYGTYPALKGVSLDVRQGEFIALVGPSGCGKTTLLKQIAGFEDATSGTIRIEGQDMAGVPAALRPTSMVFQKLALFPHMTVAENIGFPLKLRKAGAAEIAAKVNEMIRLMELKPEYLTRFPRALSGGEQQRVALARSMISSPKLLLLDEPLSALDVKLKKVAAGGAEAAAPVRRRHLRPCHA